MARIRSIKPDFWEDERVGQLSHVSRLLFIALWNFCDDAGRFRASPTLLRSQIFPYDARIDVGASLEELVGGGMIVLYEIKGQQYGFVRNFLRHQQIKNPSKPRHPDPPEEEGLPQAYPRTTPDLTQPLPPSKGKGKGKGRGEGKGEGEGKGAREALLVLERVNASCSLGWKSPHKHLLGRINAGATVDECVLVAEFKLHDWRGTEQEQYVRQETLYRESKFEGYLHAAKAWSASGRSSKGASSPAPTPSWVEEYNVTD